jgi:suppressor of tumorigenicity protein 13
MKDSEEEVKAEEKETKVEPEEPEEDDPERLPEDSEPFPEKAPPGEIELTDEQMDKMGEVKQQAVEAMEDGDLQKALGKYTEVVKMGNPTAMLYTKRAEILLKLKKPNACISDCTAAMEINPDSGKAFKLRGKAHRKLGHWEEAHQDLATGQRIDFDDDLVDVQKFVEKKFKKIAEKKTQERLQEEEKKTEERRLRKEQAVKEYEAQKKAEAEGGYPGMGGFPGGFPGGMGGFPGGMGGFPGGMGGFPSGMGGMPGGMGGMPGGMGGMPGGMDPSMMAGLFADPELQAGMQNPKIMQAMQELMSDPNAMAKYADDPEVMSFMQKMMGKFGGMGMDMDGMFPPGAGSMPSDGPTVDEVPEDTTDTGPTVEEID